MMIRAANGHYIPSYCIIQIDSNENVDKAIDDNNPTFVHEYLHFLQDLIFPYCIRQTLISNRKFQLLNSVVLHSGLLERPFNRWDEDTKITNKQTEYTWGGFEVIEAVNSITNIAREHFEIQNGAKVYKYFATTDCGRRYQVGARDFLEYIAHKIQEKNWPTEHPDFPYKTVDKIFEYYNLLNTSEQVRICLVEFCLYNDNPMNQLVFILNKIIHENNDILSSYESCKYYLLNTQWDAKGGFNENILSKTNRRLINLQESFRDKFSHPQFSEITKWFGLIIDYCEKHLANRFIFSEMFSLPHEEFIHQINTLVKDIGIPLVFNYKFECATLLPIEFDQNPFIQLYLIRQFMDHIDTTTTTCPIYDFCNKSKPEIIEDSCALNPISLTEKSSLCPFAVFLKSYGFNEAKWTTNNT